MKKINTQGIYKIKNKINEKYYLGSSNSCERRKVSHLSQLRRGIHTNSYLQNAWNKYGEENFIFEIIEVVDGSQIMLLEREQYYLDTLKPYNENVGYNDCETATGSQANKGKKFSEEHKQHLSEALKNYERTTEHCKNISIALKGKFVGEKNPFYGKQHTEETLKVLRSKLSSLNEEIVKQIREKRQNEGTPFYKLAKEFNVAKSTIMRIVKNKVWKIKE